MKKEKQEDVTYFKDLTIDDVREAIQKDMKLILKNAKRIMEKKDINQKELSLRMGSDESHISRMFKNEYHTNGLTIKVFGRMARALEVPLKELVA